MILPGTKTTIADLAFLRAQGWDIDLLAHWRRSGRVLGICGGYQMLGRRIADPDGIEGPPGEAAGLGLLDVETVLKGPKVLEEARGSDRRTGEPVAGYEMHMGRTEGPDRARPVLELAGGITDGAESADGQVAGCYLHGLFGADGFRGRLSARSGRPVGPRLWRRGRTGAGRYCRTAGRRGRCGWVAGGGGGGVAGRPMPPP